MIASPPNGARGMRTMLPLDPMSSTGGFGSNELADHMGAPARERAPLR